MDVLSTDPLGILSILGFDGSGKTDLMATTILLAIGVRPVIVCTPTHAAASNIAARVNKLASLAYGKVKEPMPVVVRGFSWKVDELCGKAYALGEGPRVFKPALYKLAKDVEKDTKIMNLKDTLQKRKGWNVEHSQTFRDLATRILQVADVKSWTGGPLNLFNKHQEISVLECVMRMQWPCWSSQRQDRIVNGGFDLAREIFYPELGDKFKYGDQCAVGKRPGAPQLESWVRRQFPEIKSSLTGKIWPVFINCLHTAVRTIDTSRVNYGQAEIALALMETLTKAHGTKFVVVSPYRATKANLEGLMGQRLDKSTKDSALYKGISNAEVSAADSFQGKKADVAIFLTTVTKESGPGFVIDARRFNVGVTRHVDFLFVVGDITTMDPV
ncbi:uncharacterized protein NECHADRAFT_87900 [Fusarium vanettenii 77-13-4]|uniref:DNA2/NAM7 helicase-like C-terminal domain-containing protein n=1 Tax=Fusarium vanettenii (strain ATCC MYA-4622 / CBS 123669 / FGSC 9596 / NRRL 45880 / 77-13-4) TaxID=660122 RepID=C7Z3C5_FUSV7|nr:uncharacterized protein NECHADRAFT_87900 [Fusarium vanettenii 77-13-4]EEU41631.1 hypothetical protein NECHADRAFT_87900 [Fusarium vanettenii 77-13-4]